MKLNKIACKTIIFSIIITVMLPLASAAQQAYIDSIIILLNKTPAKADKLVLYLNLSKACRNVNPYAGLAYADSGLLIIKELKNPKVEAEFINEIGVLYRKVDMYEHALESHQAAMAIFEKIGNKMGIAYS
nr:hypothetical protein [Bacteroidota bacterium]